MKSRGRHGTSRVASSKMMIDRFELEHVERREHDMLDWNLLLHAIRNDEEAKPELEDFDNGGPVGKRKPVQRTYISIYE